MYKSNLSSSVKLFFNKPTEILYLWIYFLNIYYYNGNSVKTSVIELACFLNGN
jgi:hypothetical protein